ncbi:MAG TPA: TIR domain-containing protein [Opitutaceae bacterium]|nr:TIR domain-containing protein [Opitutaceae bacterium]
MNKAIFLSYASQDAEAARRICDALRASGIEVWFDRSELRGGDAWDQKIRKQIKDCALFVPVVSANTQHRDEGYFRLEWHLAEQRSLLMARGRPFIVPVCIDATADAEALVPEAFLAVQWMRLPGGEVPASFSERLKTLLHVGPTGVTSHPPFSEPPRANTTPVPTRSSRRMKRALMGVGIVMVGIAVAVTLLRRSPHVEAGKAASPFAAPAEKLTPARELVARAWAMTSKGSVTRDQLDAAGELCERALQLDPTDAQVWAAAARIDLLLIYPYGYDRSGERRKRAIDRAMRASNLDPDAVETRAIRAAVLAHAVATPALLAEAEKTFRELIKSHPGDNELVIQLAEVLREAQRFGEAAELFESVGEFEVAGWSYYLGGELQKGLAAVRRAPRATTALQLNTILEIFANEDLDAAQAVMNRMTPSELLAEMPAANALRLAKFRREPERMLEITRGLGRDFLDSRAFRGPRGYFTGVAHLMAGRTAQAEAEWRAALVGVDARLKAAPDDRLLLLWAAWLHAGLHDTAAAEAIFARSQALEVAAGEANELINYLVLMQLRKKEALLTALEETFQIKAPTWEVVHAEMRFSPEVDFMRGNPRFEKLLRDNLPVGAKPFSD